MSVEGTFDITINTPMGKEESKLTLAANGGELTGTMQQPGKDEITVDNGTVEGANVTWSADVTSPIPLTLKFAGQVDGDAIGGEVELGMYGKSDFTGTRA